MFSIWCFTKNVIRHESLRVLLMVAAVLTISLMAPSARANPFTKVLQLVEKLTVETVRNRQSLENTFSIRLRPDEGTSIFSFWLADDLVIDGLPIESISYRQPRLGAGATAGPLLVLLLAKGVCLDSEALLARFPAMEPAAPSSPHDPNPTLSYSRQTEDATLTLGFPLLQPNCLSKIIYSLKKP